MNRRQNTEPVAKNDEFDEADRNFKALDRQAFYSQYGGMSQYQSASTLRHSVYQYSFPKAERFPRIKIYSETPSELSIPSTLKSRSTSFGYGEKYIVPKYVWQKAAEYPPPNKYAEHKPFVEVFENKRKIKGRTFGLSRENFKNYVPELPFNKDLLAFPSPGKYKLREDPGKDKVKYSLHIKFKDYFKNENPTPDKYSPNMKLVYKDRFTDIGFGFGDRPEINPLKDILKDNPGPGQYTLPSAFDKFKINRRAITRTEPREKN